MIIHPKDIVEGKPSRPESWPSLQRFPSNASCIVASSDSRMFPRGKRKEWNSAVPRVSKVVEFSADYSLGLDDIRAKILMLGRMRSELLTKVLADEEKKYLGKKRGFQGSIYCPEDDYDIGKVSAVAGNGWQSSSLWQAVSFCERFVPRGDFITAVPLFTKIGEKGKEVIAFQPEAEGREWTFGFHPAKVSGKFPKELRVFLVRPY